MEAVRLARPRSRPEARDAVVGPRRQDVADRVPVQRPDRKVVRVRDAVRGIDRHGRRHGRVRAVVGRQRRRHAGRRIRLVQLVVEQAPVDPTRRQQRDVHGMPRQRRDVSVVTAEQADVAHDADVEDASGLVPGTCRQQLPARRLEHGPGDGVLVTAQRRQTAARPGIPELDEVVLRARDEYALGRVPVDRLDVPVVTRQRGLLGAAGEVKDLDGRVVRGRHELGVGRAKRKIPDGIGMGLQHFDVVEVRLPVLDRPFLVGRQEPIVAVGVNGGPDRGVVCLCGRSPSVIRCRRSRP